MLVRSSASGLLGSSWLLLSLLLLCLIFGLGGCGREPLVLVSVLGLDSQISQLSVHTRLDGMPLGEDEQFPATPPYFRLSLPRNSRGRLEVIVEAQDGDRCGRARGRGFVDVISDEQVAVDVFLVAQPFASCRVRVKLPEQMLSRVASSGGELSCAGSCEIAVPKGRAMTLRVETASGEHLLGFRSPCSGTDSCHVTVDRPLDVEVAVVRARVCSPDLVCWDSPTPQGQTLRGLWAASPTDAWAVGDHGALLHFDGHSWAGLSTPVRQPLSAVWGSSATAVWAVGAAGTIVSYDGRKWQQLSSPATEWLHSIWGSGPSDIYAVGENGALVHFDGKTWEVTKLPTTMAFSVVFGTGAQDIWALGYGSDAWHFDGKTWSATPLGGSLLLSAAWGVSPTDLWAVGYDYTSKSGVILHGDGRSWIRYFGTGGPRLSAIFGSDGDLFAVGEQGLLLRFIRGRWENLPRVTSSWLHAVGALGVRQGLIVGEGGVTLGWDGITWRNVNAGETGNILAMTTVESGEVWMVGEGGLVLRGRDGHFDRVASTSLDTLRGIWAGSSDDVWMVGDFGTILHYSSGRMDLLSSGTRADLLGIYGVAESDLWIVGRGGLVLHYDGQGLSQVDTGLPNALLAISGTSSNDIWVVGEHGVILHKVGSEWRRSYSRTGDSLRGVHAVSQSEAWLVGENGVIIRYTGSAYEYDFVGDEKTPITLLSITGSPAGELVTVGQSGAMFRFDGKSWPTVDSGTSNALNVVRRDAKGRYWLAGQGGAVLHLDPK